MSNLCKSFALPNPLNLPASRRGAPCTNSTPRRGGANGASTPREKTSFYRLAQNVKKFMK